MIIDPQLEELIEAVPEGEEVEVILRLLDPKNPPPGVRIISQFGDIVTCRVRSDRIRDTRAHELVASVKAARVVNAGPPVKFETEEYDDVNVASIGNDGYRTPRQFTGKNIVVAALDWGIDFAQDAFRRNDGKTRLLAIWDQSASMSSEKPNPYGYGRIYLRDEIDKALQEKDPYTALGYHHAKSDPLGIGCHGTHVVDIAAGSRRLGPQGWIQGVAPECDLIFVHLGAARADALSSLGDSVRVLEGIDFVAKTAGERPWVINTSFGSQGGQHDGKSLVEKGMDNLLLAAPGRAICMSTGNYRQARAHANGRIRLGRKHVFIWIVHPADVTPNELEIWYSGGDVFMISIEIPDGIQTFSAALGERASILVNGQEVGRIYHRKDDPNNHDNQINIFLYPGAPAGEWKVILRGIDVVNGNYHVWIERDRGNPQNQSRLEKADATQDYTTGTICNGERTIAVGAFDSRTPNRIPAPFSSCGPTRNDRQKPDILCPGVQILAARSTPADAPAPVPMLVAKSGSSMAAPCATGAVALIFEATPRKLSIQETHEIIIGSADKISDNEECSGDGYLNIDRALDAALKIGETDKHLSEKKQIHPISEVDGISSSNAVSSIPVSGGLSESVEQSQVGDKKVVLFSHEGVEIDNAERLSADGGIGYAEEFAEGYDEELDEEKGSFEDEPLPASSSTTPDPLLAIPPFSNEKCTSIGTLLTPAQSKASVLWNSQQHPKYSGLDPARIVEALQNYVDVFVVNKAIANYNSQNPTATVNPGTQPIDAVFVEAIHQFQMKCYKDPNQHDGKAGPSTLDSLGFWPRKGLLSSANTNEWARKRVRLREKMIEEALATIPSELARNLKAIDWWSSFVNPGFLGWGFVRPIHVYFARKLRKAEQSLLSMPRFAGKTPIEMSVLLDINEKHVGGRNDPGSKSIHTLGLAIDIKYSGNPHVGDYRDKPEGAKLFSEVMKRATAKISGLNLSKEKFPEYLHKLGSDKTKTTSQIYDELFQRDQDLRKYLVLAEADRDLSALKKGVFKGSVERDPRKGFLNLDKDMVITLRDYSCLVWGAVDFGPNANGDIMHFDCRLDDFGRAVYCGTGGFFNEKHPCWRGSDMPCPEAKRKPSTTKPPPVSELSHSTEAPLLLKYPTKSDPPGQTIYVQINLGEDKRCIKIDEHKECVRYETFSIKKTTGIFIPENYSPQREVDLILYLHGHKDSIPGSDAVIAEYWDAYKYPVFALREEINASKKNIILVAPTLGLLSEAGDLVRRNGLDDYLDRVLEALRTYGSYRGQSPDVGNIILASHSGGGVYMRKLALSSNRYAANVKECWGFDSLYNSSDVEHWLRWAENHPQSSFYSYYFTRSPTINSHDLLKRKAPNIQNIHTIESTIKDHFKLVRVYLSERLKAAQFLKITNGGAVEEEMLDTDYQNTINQPIGSELVGLADEAISEAPHSSGALLVTVLSNAGITSTLSPVGIKSSNLLSPEKIFDIIVFGKNPAMRRNLEKIFEVIGEPGSTLKVYLRPGDLLFRRILGTNFGHVALVAAPERWSYEQLPEGLIPERNQTGEYVQVVEGGACPHSLSDSFARRILDQNGCVPPNQLVLRIKQTSEQLEDIGLQEDLITVGIRPSPNAVDADAAEPIFAGLVRKPSAPLPGVAALKEVIQWNKNMHPKVSGISLAELRARLEQYIDRPALDDLVRQANAGASTPLYDSDEATIITLLADQFQLKTCRKPTVDDLSKPCTTGGMVAEDTLDGLGFVYHLGKTTDLNWADQVNRTAADTLKKVRAIEFKDVEPGLTAKTWWTYMVRPPWLGMPIKQGIHLVLLKRLRRAQQFLMSLPAYDNLSPAELGKVLGLEEEHKGARPWTATKSMHTFGLGIDIGYTHNPWLSNPERNTEKIAAITLRAAQFIGGKSKNQKGITAKFLHQLAIDNRDTTKIYKILSEWSNCLGSYFALATDPKRIESQLPVLNAINPDIGFIQPSENSADAAKRWTRIIKSDFDDFATAVSRGGNKEGVRNGFMNLPRDLVLALREYACLAWGAVDFGPSESGDVMHFDCRVDGICRAIRIATGNTAPEEGHPCIPTREGKTTQREIEEDAPKPPPQPLSFKFKSKIIPTYKDQDGDLQSTDCSIFVPSALQNQKEIDVLVFFHGLDTCKPYYRSDPDLVVKNFRLNDQVDKAARKVALAVPVVFWNKKFIGDIKSAWSAVHLNAFVDEVLDEIVDKSGVRHSLGRLFLVGHSKAYEILTPLANEFDKGVVDTTKGALAKLTEVWSLDTTYGANPSHALVKWASKLKTKKFTLVLHLEKYPDCKFEENKDYPPIKYWECAMAGVTLPKNLDIKKVSEDHCCIPNEYVKTLLKFEPEIRNPELLDPEGNVTLPTPVLHLEKVKISGLPEIILTLGSGGRYDGFFVTPIHLRDDQTSYAQSTQIDIELTGRIQIEDSGIRRNYDSKKDGKEWPLVGVKGSAHVKIVNADGPSISSVLDWKVRPDGTFAFTTNIIVGGFTRSLTIYPKVDLKGGKTITATVVVELIDLDGFLALVDPKEKARPPSQTHLEFLASVRKIYQGGPKDPLRGAFNEVLFRYRYVKPLVPPGTAEDLRFKLYKDWLFADREWVDIGHVLTGIEGSPKQEPSKDQNVPMPSPRRELLVTWAGDLGSALQAYIKDFWNAIDKGNPVDLKDYLLKLASRIDLIGDIDGINIGTAYDSSRSLAGNLHAYYGTQSRRRYHNFIANSKDQNGKAELPLVSGKKPPQLSKQARQAIARNTKLFLDPLWILGKLYGGTDPSKRKLVDEIVKEDSPEMNIVVEYFARFLEDGLAREP